MLKDGTCEPCGAYEKATFDRKYCEVAKCDQRQKVLPDATCEDCPMFQVGDTSGIECEFPRCPDR